MSKTLLAHGKIDKKIKKVMDFEHMLGRKTILDIQKLACIQRQWLKILVTYLDGESKIKNIRLDEYNKLYSIANLKGLLNKLDPIQDMKVRKALLDLIVFFDYRKKVVIETKKFYL